jgi:transcriptional regulator of arginine metabolism
MNIYAHGDVLRRREEVVRIIRERPVHSQDELLALLKKRGWNVTQPTLSRDMKELGIAKTPRGYVAPGDMASVSPIAAFTPREVREGRLEALVRDSVISAEAAGNLVVIKTPAAAAQPVASAIDATDEADILGTIGGDDCIFVAMATPHAAESMARRFRSIAGLTPARRVARG